MPYKLQFVCMVNLKCILVTYPEWGQKVPPLSLFGGGKRHQNDKMGAKSAPTYNKQRVQGENYFARAAFRWRYL